MKLGVPRTWPVTRQVTEPAHLLGQAEVADLGMSVAVQQDVAGLEIAVDDAVLVGVGHGLGHLPDQLAGLPRRQRTMLDPIRQAAPFDVAHREVVLALVLPDLEDGHDARVVELGSRLGLPAEALDLLG